MVGNGRGFVCNEKIPRGLRQLLIDVLACELPLDAASRLIARLFPGEHFGAQSRLLANAPSPPPRGGRLLETGYFGIRSGGARLSPQSSDCKVQAPAQFELLPVRPQVALGGRRGRRVAGFELLPVRPQVALGASGSTLPSQKA